MKTRAMFACLLGICFMLSFILTYGCGTTTSTSRDEGYFPHKDGYSWTHQKTTTITTPEGIQYHHSTKETYYFEGTTVITDEITAQNYCKEGSTEVSYYMIDRSGAYFFGDSQNPTTEAMIVLSYPLTVGKKWKGINGITAEVCSYESVSPPIGTFYGYKICHDSGDNDELHEWYVHNIGKIKEYRKTLIPTEETINGETRTIPVTREITSVLKSKNF